MPCLQDIEAHLLSINQVSLKILYFSNESESSGMILSTKATDLIAHPDQGGEDELEHHPTLVRHQIPHILQDVEAGPIEVAVAKVG